MSLWVNLRAMKMTEVHSANITHNLGKMAREAGIYMHVWRPEEIGIERAGDLVKPLADAVALMKSEPDRFKVHDADNGWGTYKDFLPWLEKYLAACKENPGAIVEVSR